MLSDARRGRFPAHLPGHAKRPFRAPKLTKAMQREASHEHQWAATGDPPEEIGGVLFYRDGCTSPGCDAYRARRPGVPPARKNR